MRRLGIDHGEKRVGLSLSDEEGLIASPLTTLPRENADKLLDLVVDKARELAVEEIVVGLPLNLDGSEGASARRARRFAERLELAAELPVVLWDERMSTLAAQRSLREAGITAKKQKDMVDRVAAAVLLQSYLDAKG